MKELRTAPTLTSGTPNSDAMLGEKLLRRTTNRETAALMQIPENREAVSTALKAMEASLKPATIDQVAASIEALSVFHHEPKRDAAAHRVWVRGWVEDFKKFPADIIEEACRQWRRNSNPFMPKPGQLLAIAEPLLEQRRFWRDRATEFLKIPAPEPQKKREAPEISPEARKRIADDLRMACKGIPRHRKHAPVPQQLRSREEQIRLLREQADGEVDETDRGSRTE